MGCGINMQKLKVLQLISSMGDGGAQQIVINYLKDFVQDDRIECKLLVMENKTNSKYDKYLEKNNFDVDYLNIPKKYSNIPLYNAFKRIIKLNNLINDYIKKYKPDIVHIHMTGSAVFCIKYIRKNRDIVNFITIHSNPLRDKGNDLKAMKYILHLSNVIPVSVNDEQDKLAKMHYNINKGEIVRNGIDIAEIKKKIISKDKARKLYNVSKDAFLVIGVGRLNKIKRYDILINSFARVLANNNKALLLIAGKGEERSNLEELVKKLKIENSVRFLGNQENIIPLYCAADVLVVSSKTESSSLVLVEAQVCKTRCVISNGTPNESIITNKVFKMKENATIDEWKEAILNVNYKGKQVCDINDYEVHNISKKMVDIYLKRWKDHNDGK